MTYVYAILACVESDDLLLKTDPGQSEVTATSLLASNAAHAVFAWRSTLSSQPMKKSNQRSSLPSLYAQHLVDSCCPRELIRTLQTF